MKLTYFGHSALRFDIQGVSILVDPFLSGNPSARGVVSADTVAADVILLTHAHGDHWGDTAAIARRTGALVVANFEITSYLQAKHGYDRVHSMNTGGSWDFPWGRVIQTYARHSSSFPDGTYGGNPNGYLLYAEGRCLYAMGDTAPFAEMAWIGEEHDVDVAFMPVGDNYTMGPNDSRRVARMIAPALTVPVHYNTFDPIRIDVAAWARRMDAAGFRTRVMNPGESFELDPA